VLSLSGQGVFTSQKVVITVVFRFLKDMETVTFAMTWDLLMSYNSTSTFSSHNNNGMEGKGHGFKTHWLYV
jgi:hypothetical protein